MPSPWKRNAVVFLFSQPLSLLGSSLVQYALMWTVTLKTGSGIMMTLYILCGFIPVFLIAPFAGVVADRFDRKRIIMIADGMIALVTLLLGMVLDLEHDALWLVFVAAAARAAGHALHGPAVGAFLTSMMPLGMLLFGPLAELVSIEWILLITGAAMAALGLTLPFNRSLMKAGEPAVAVADQEVESV